MLTRPPVAVAVLVVIGLLGWRVRACVIVSDEAVRGARQVARDDRLGSNEFGSSPDVKDVVETGVAKSRRTGRGWTCVVFSVQQPIAGYVGLVIEKRGAKWRRVFDQATIGGAPECGDLFSGAHFLDTDDIPVDIGSDEYPRGQRTRHPQ